jgi:CDP-diacylglycerol--serine O-phosphatidyltransferase
MNNEYRVTKHEIREMRRLKTQAAKKSLLRRVRRQRLKYVTILPSLITILNGVCGFAAIVFASKGAFVPAGYMILLAMIADMLDGRLARRVKSTSSFGGQLDSLCDVISFGVAPAFLMVKLLEYEIESGGFANESFLQRFPWLTAAVYISCAAIRLARFNVENEEDESAHMSFIGLPTPAAAGVIVSVIILHQEEFSTLNVIIYVLPVLALGVAVLMVSRIRYPHVLNQYLRGQKPFAHLIRVLLLLAFVIWNIQAALVLIFCGFAASSFLKWLFYKVIRNKGNLVSETQHPALMTVNEGQVGEQDDSAGGAEN